ncbi:quinone-dependent dihydroorotate dehydrogenase [Micrococcales bacterium 31B]|nr:quinone-dependent dihydroorotate dehydrogenase [Micrococcales bacterium 31B]
MLYPLFFKTVFARMDPEVAHERAFAAIRIAARLPVIGELMRRVCWSGESARDRVEVMGVEFPHRFGLAAGFDKNARGIVALTALGFGHVEIGTVTGEPQSGNEQPRLFRLIADRCLINRMGFNNEGAAAVARRLAEVRSTRDGRKAVIGVNIGKTKVVAVEDAIGDYVKSAHLLAPFADYLVVNVSSPNTPGLRDLQSVESLRPLLQAVREASELSAARHVPLLVKIAPDLADDDVLAVARLSNELGLDGIIATNTTIARPDSLRTPAGRVAEIGAGGLSGPILADRSLEVLRLLRGAVSEGTCLISVGGIETGADARRRVFAGADLVQGYSAFVYEGPLWARRVRLGLRGAESRLG